jgi:hypothetical protein
MHLNATECTVTQLIACCNAVSTVSISINLSITLSVVLNVWIYDTLKVYFQELYANNRLLNDILRTYLASRCKNDQVVACFVNRADATNINCNEIYVHFLLICTTTFDWLASVH